MTIAAKTIIWKGAVLSVRNSDNTAWVDFANCIDYSLPRTPAVKIPASTAASLVDQFRLGLQDIGQGVFNVFDYMDSPFLAAVDTMQDGGETRRFKLVLPEGQKTTRIFDAYVVDQPVTGAYNTLWKLTLTLKVVNDYWYLYPTPTAASMSPATGTAAGGTSVTVTGNNFEDDVTTVNIGGVIIAAADVTVVSRTSLTFVTPAHSAATVTVSVSTPTGTSSNISGGFIYT
jgi:hypothetical protein